MHFFTTKFSRPNSTERELGRFLPLGVEQFKIHPPFLKATFSRWAGSKVPDNLTRICRLLQRKVVGQLEGAEEETGNWGNNNGVGGGKENGPVFSSSPMNLWACYCCRERAMVDCHWKG